MTMTDTAERIRSAMIDAAIRAYEDAGMSGLCLEGRWEAAVSAMRLFDLEPILETTSEAGQKS